MNFFEGVMFGHGPNFLRMNTEVKSVFCWPVQERFLLETNHFSSDVLREPFVSISKVHVVYCGSNAISWMC